MLKAFLIASLLVVFIYAQQQNANVTVTTYPASPNVQVFHDGSEIDRIVGLDWRMYPSFSIGNIGQSSGQEGGASGDQGNLQDSWLYGVTNVSSVAWDPAARYLGVCYKLTVTDLSSGIEQDGEIVILPQRGQNSDNLQSNFFGNNQHAGQVAYWRWPTSISYVNSPYFNWFGGNQQGGAAGGEQGNLISRGPFLYNAKLHHIVQLRGNGFNLFDMSNLLGTPLDFSSGWTGTSDPASPLLVNFNNPAGIAMSVNINGNVLSRSFQGGGGNSLGDQGAYFRLINSYMTNTNNPFYNQASGNGNDGSNNQQWGNQIVTNSFPDLINRQVVLVQGKDTRGLLCVAIERSMMSPLFGFEIGQGIAQSQQ